MSKRSSAWIAVLCAVLTLGAIGDVRAERRIALVIGNAHYGNPSLALSNPKNDAEDVAAALRGVGFEVLQATDANKRDMDLAMAKFARQATDSDAALFFYAGHALQYQGRNYLIPTDAEVEDEISLRYQLMPIDDVRAALDRATGVKVMILDACRNNPIVESIRRRASGETRNFGGGSRGLARIDKTQGMVIAYSTAADEVAADGRGRNSPFTRAFLKRIKEPGLEIEQLFRRVAADVNSETGGRQRPETYVSLLSDYYLNQTDRIAFDDVKEAADPAALRDFITKFPSSSFVTDARYRIQRIELQAQERQLQQARQQDAARILEEQRRQDEARAKAAESERARAEREAAQRLQDEQRRNQTARLDPPALAPDPPRPNARQQVAAVERQDLKAPETRPEARIDPVVTPPLPPPVSSTQSCEQDNARLTRLRSNPTLNEITQFERELGCERLRPQVVRLRESLGPAALPSAASASAEPIRPPPPPAAVQPRPEPPKPPEQQANLNSLPAAQPVPPAIAVDQGPACKQDEARLAKLRANPSLADVITFERELRCDRLRRQIARLRESLGPADQATATGDSSSRQVDIKQPASPALSPEQSCERDRATLARLRSSSSRDDVVRFERELACEHLRPQVLRLRESLANSR
ncbi:caspase family protein [Bradyrhizobium prioriisuperbiae]|uniref:caspase family protein n=1 Tax=Bradyrhizobium prioriisuperbiae TaxID=2854389 RepID=UPI0028E51428|nr:caspase family protein [Bradyrhizobium prioritasuperba]